MKKGFYVIGRNLDEEKAFSFGIDVKCFKTFEEAKVEKSNLEDEHNFENVQVDILEVD